MRYYIRKIAALLLFVSPFVSFVSFAQENKAQAPRKFNDVLNDLLNEFSYDLKTNQVKGIQNVSVRKVIVNESIPKSYENYLEDLITERLRTHSKIKVIQCTNCKLKRSRVENGRVVISSPINNPAELDGLSRDLGIEVWIDAALLYQETNMILALKAFDAKTKELVWTKVYNSEKIEKNVSTMDEPTVERDEEGNYIAQYITNVSAGVYSVPNVGQNETMIGLGIRIAEQFNGRHAEVGASITPLFSPKLVASNYSTSKKVEGTEAAEETITNVKDVEPWTIGAKVAATYHYTFWDGKENYDNVRYGVGAAVGGIIAPGYLTLYGRGSMHARFGKRWQLELGADYHMPTTISVQNVKFTTEGGTGYDIAFGFLF